MKDKERSLMAKTPAGQENHIPTLRNPLSHSPFYIPNSAFRKGPLAYPDYSQTQPNTVR
ncbi:MAG TPA: hypothetical protein VGK99_10315 [Acidobacteriota bacterium]